MQMLNLTVAPALLLSALGLGTWALPGMGAGVRACVGIALVSMALMVGHSVAGLPLAPLAWGLFGLGLGGLWRCRPVPADLLHPLLVFTAAFSILVLVRGGVSYVPWGDDEFINWLTPAKQLFLARWQFAPHILFSNPSYPPAWPALLSLPSVLAGRFSQDMAGLVPFALHVAFLGLVFDIARSRLDRLSSWGFVLFALAVEISWRLLPLNLLSEQPQVYAESAVFLLLLWTAWAKGEERRGLLAAAGLMAAQGYLIKAAGIVAVPALALAAAWPLLSCWRDLRRRLAPAVFDMILLAAPVAAVYLIWARMAPGSSCSTSLGSYLSVKGIADLAVDRAGPLSEYVRAVAAYYGSYKVPLSVVALAGLGLGLARAASRAAILAVLAYFALYLGALFWSYQTCPVNFNYYLSSLERYILVPLRVLHAVGLMVLALELAPRLIRLRGYTALAGAAILLLAGWQAWRLSHDLAEIGLRDNGRAFAATGEAIVATEPALRRALANRPDKARVLQLAEFGYPYPHYPTRHYLLNSDGATLPFEYCLATGYGESIRFAGLDCPFPNLDQALARSDILWALSLTPALADAVRPFLAPACPADFSGTVLVRGGSGRFACPSP
ncbi:protein of unknown function [Magnetospirillum sp. XM-1]|uniref:hypothetical protein n=1 Tax=Magnetospirillum sp. XM-1 TaxID=1663591 RepID=UPI00073DFBC5|nr:hypothetical protein [Magnetospirillum sp. XM-1]CUW38068.1 protein of unknown function [Magnetospirillum sp. XM-1]